MTIAQAVLEKLQALPEQKQRQVLDYVERLIEGSQPATPDSARELAQLIQGVLSRKPLDIRPDTVRELIEDGRER